MDVFSEFICPICKKGFMPAPYHVYKKAGTNKFVCSYSCMLESERRRKNKKRHSIRPEITLTLDGETHSIKEWADITGISERILRSRYRYGWSAERILKQKIKNHKERV